MSRLFSILKFSRLLSVLGLAKVHLAISDLSEGTFGLSGTSWGYVGPSWGAKLGWLRAMLGHLSAILSHLGFMVHAMLGASWRYVKSSLKLSQATLEPC